MARLSLKAVGERVSPLGGRESYDREFIFEGAFFVLSGVMLFIAEIGEPEYKRSTVRDNRRERLRVIFENGTEFSMYRQLLGIRMGSVTVWRSCQRPSSRSSRTTYKPATSMSRVHSAMTRESRTSPTCTRSGSPVGQSKSASPVRSASPPISWPQSRLSRATARTTSIRRRWNTRVFADARLRVSQVGNDGRTYEPSEWFSVPLSVIN